MTASGFSGLNHALDSMLASLTTGSSRCYDGHLTHISSLSITPLHNTTIANVVTVLARSSACLAATEGVANHND